ncbi:MAG: flagellar biosynthesis/type III secretory pathway protein FliH [Candidatus Azotimanducaceae bacterium]|jgi:flagellar biosynthesis/type III secretory pathway protein FliH
MSKLAGRIPSSQISKSTLWTLPVINLDEGSDAKIFRLKGDVAKSKKNQIVSKTKKSGSKDRLDDQSLSDNGVSADDEGSLLDPGEGSLLEPAEGALSKPAEGALLEPAEGALSEPAEGAQSSTLEDVELNNSEKTVSDGSEIPDLDATKGSLASETEGFQKGEAEGFQAGESAGREHGLQEVRKELEASFNEEMKDKRLLLDNLLTAFETPPDQMKQVESSLVSLITSVSEVVILSELKSNPALIGTLVTSALAALPHGAKNLKVRVHKDNIAFLNEEFSDLNLEYIEDKNLSIGSCQIQTENSSVDAKLGDRIRTSLMQVFSKDSMEEIKELDLVELTGEIDPEC